MEVQLLCSSRKMQMFNFLQMKNMFQNEYA